MSSGSVLDDCHEVRTCCCCIPLRIGCVWIALAGIVMAAWGAVCILLTTLKQSHLESVGLSGELGHLCLFIFAVLNFLLLLASLCLLCGACKRNNTLVTIYVWFLAIYMIMMLIVMLLAIISCAIADSIHSLVMFMLVAILIVIVFAHFFLVANSYRMRTL